MTSAPGSGLGDGIRADFPVLQRTLDGNRITYLDNAATALKPQVVIDTLVDYYSRVGANIHRGRHWLSEEASTLFEEARSHVAQFAGCFGNEVIFVRNATEGLNLAAAGLGLTPSDLVVGVLDAHHSQLLPWRRTATLKLVRVDGEGHLDLDHYQALLRERPKVVALSHCSNVTGLYSPLERMVELARSVGAVTVVDAAQSIGHRRINFARLGVDFLAFSSHKMMGPTGVGVLIGRRELLERMPPLLLGGGTVDWVDLNGHELRKIPHRHEAGTPDIAGVIGLGAAIGYLENRLGFENIERHDAQLAEAFREGACARDYLEVIGPRKSADKTAILSVRVKQAKNLSDVARMLSDSYGIMCRTGHHCAQPLVDHFSTAEVLRASAYAYNTPQDVALFFKALDEIRAKLPA